MMKAEDLNHAKNGTAILVACLVQTLNESDQSFQRRFLDRLEASYRELRDNTDGNTRQEIELLTWTRSLLTGFNAIDGQGKPWLQK